MMFCCLNKQENKLMTLPRTNSFELEVFLLNTKMRYNLNINELCNTCHGTMHYLCLNAATHPSFITVSDFPCDQSTMQHCWRTTSKMHQGIYCNSCRHGRLNWVFCPAAMATGGSGVAMTPECYQMEVKWWFIVMERGSGLFRELCSRAPLHREKRCKKTSISANFRECSSLLIAHTSSFSQDR